MYFRLKHIFFSFLAVTLFTFPGPAQLFNDYNFQFRTYTTSDGLAHNMVKKCRSDSRGFLWIITENGLSRFDGHQFRNYRGMDNDSTSLHVNNLWDLALDEQDHIYLAYRYGLCVFDPANGTFSVIRMENKDIGAEKIAWDSKRKLLFIATGEKGLLKYDPASRKVSTTALNTKLAGDILDLYIDHDDHVWAMIERMGYYRYHISRDSAYYYNSFDWPTSLYQDKDGIYYLSTWGSGFQVFDAIKDEHQKKIYQLKLSDLPGNSYISMAAAEAPALTGTDILWVPTAGSGVGLFSKSQKKFIHHFTYAPQVRSGSPGLFNNNIYYAPDGVLWICSWHGLVKVSPQQQYFQNAELPELHSALYNCVTGIIDDPYDSTVSWMAINGDGIAKYNKKTRKITARYFYDELNVRHYYLERWPVFLYQDTNRVIWSCSYGGIIKIQKGNVSFIELKIKNDYCFTGSNARDKKGHIWLAGQLLIQFDPYTGNYRGWDIPQESVNKKVFYQGACGGDDGLTYVACNQGLYSIDAAKNKITKLQFATGPKDSVLWNNPLSVASINHTIYIGCAAGLLAFDTRTGKTKEIAPESRLNISRNAFYTDNNQNLWIYCISGVYLYNTKTSEITQFTTADGIYSHSNDPAYFFEYGGSTYLGYRMAYTKFNPLHIENNQNIPVPYITEVQPASGKAFSPAGSTGLKLPYDRNDINFDFTAIEYNFPGKIRFSYMLEGFDKDWSPLTTERKKNYTNLPPGNYTFRVKAFSNNGKESRSAAAYSFTIAPAFWQTLLFRLIAGLLLLGLAIWVYRKRIKQVTERQEEKNKLQQVQLEQYRQQLEMEQIISYFTSSISGKKTQEEILWDVARNLIRQLGFKDCMIYLWNEDKTLLLQKAGYDQTGALGETDKPAFTVAPWQGIVGHVAATKKAILVNDTSKDERYRPDALVRGSELCVPALYGDELISVIDSEDYNINYYTQQHLQILTTIATLMAAKLVSVRADEEARRKQETVDNLSRQMMSTQLETIRQELEIQQITSFFSGSLVGKDNIRDVLRDVAGNLIGKLGFEDCMIYRWNVDRTSLVQEAGHGVKGAIEHTAFAEKYNIPAGKGIVGAAVASKQALLINDTSLDPRYISADGIIRMSELCVPIMSDDNVIGAINIEHSEKNFFTKRHIQTVSTIAALVSSKIKALESSNALHQKQLELEKTNRQLAEREVAMLRSQMNPHFIFNSLNSIQKYIWENKEEDAAEYLSSFAKLIRSILENSRHEYISLDKETAFLKLYIDLENRRSNNNFNYTIRLDPSLDTEHTLIPPMLLQPFIENAIWHGLSKKQEKGNLLVYIYRQNDELICLVDDDGAGRQEKEKDSEKKSLGISITMQRIEKLIENTSRSASVTIKDKVENGKPAGTTVTVILSLITDKANA